MIEATNLDAMEADELREWAGELPADLPRRDRFLLASYAWQKADAMDYRATGSIARAIVLELRCERIYRLLPGEYRW